MHFTKASLICYLIIYVVLMSVGAGVAIPGGLFMPSLIVGSSWGALFGMQLREWLPDWNIQPGVYALMAGTGGWLARAWGVPAAWREGMASCVLQAACQLPVVLLQLGLCAGLSGRCISACCGLRACLSPGRI